MTKGSHSPIISPRRLGAMVFILDSLANLLDDALGKDSPHDFLRGLVGGFFLLLFLAH